MLLMSQYEKNVIAGTEIKQMEKHLQKVVFCSHFAFLEVLESMERLQYHKFFTLAISAQPLRKPLH